MSVAHVTPQRQPPADLLTASKVWGILEDLSVSLTDFVEDTDVGAAASASNNSR